MHASGRSQALDKQMRGVAVQERMHGWIDGWIDAKRWMESGCNDREQEKMLRWRDGHVWWFMDENRFGDGWIAARMEEGLKIQSTQLDDRNIRKFSCAKTMRQRLIKCIGSIDERVAIQVMINNLDQTSGMFEEEKNGFIFKMMLLITFRWK